MSESFHDGRVILHQGDCLEVLDTLPENSLDACVCDPPYFLTSIAARFGAEGAAPAKKGNDGSFARLSGGFMGCMWDAPEAVVVDPGFANWFAGFVDGEGCFSVHRKNVNGCEVFDCQFSITLRHDDAGILLEMQRQLGGIGSFAERASREVTKNPQARWCVSSQDDCVFLREVLTIFPLRAKKVRDFHIWSQALDEWIAHSPGESWTSVAYLRDRLMAVKRYGATYHPAQVFHYRWASKTLRVLKPGAYIVAFSSSRTFGRMSVAIEDAGFINHPLIGWVFGSGFPKATRVQAEGYEGHRYGAQALKPALEPIYVGMKPFSERTGTANILKWGTGAVNIDACRVGTEDAWSSIGERRGTKLVNALGSSLNNSGRTGSHSFGRWPANLITDGSPEVLAAFPKSDGQQRAVDASFAAKKGTAVFGDYGPRPHVEPRGDSGSAARFFYQAKADDDDRLGSKHPTVKPVDLMRWLVRLHCPKGGTVLDPFAGTGSTGHAALIEGMRAILIEQEAEYCADIARRMDLVFAGREERARKLVTRDDSPMPLFGELA